MKKTKTIQGNHPFKDYLDDMNKRMSKYDISTSQGATKPQTIQGIEGFTILEFTDRWKSMSEDEQINELRRLLKEQATELIEEFEEIIGEDELLDTKEFPKSGDYATPHQAWRNNLRSEMREKLYKLIRKWTKGRKIDKEKLREYLNTL